MSFVNDIFKNLILSFKNALNHQTNRTNKWICIGKDCIGDFLIKLENYKVYM